MRAVKRRTIARTARADLHRAQKPRRPFGRRGGTGVHYSLLRLRELLRRDPESSCERRLEELRRDELPPDWPRLLLLLRELVDSS
jgi:hypothetical protein